MYPYRSPRARATTARQTIMPTLHWIGKEKVQTHHNDVPYRVLKQQYTYGNVNNTCGDDASRVVKNIRAAGDVGASPAVVGVDTDSLSLGGVGEVNKIIHGDNLEALKALLPEYENRVDCIYIDPPYNTGNEGWVYNDNVNDPHIRKWLGAVVGKEAEDLTRHDKWLCMMYPRLVLLQKLLSPTGAIFISIDDNEQANLKLICDEIFGAGNFISDFIWHKKVRPSNKLVDKERNASLGISLNTEYVLCYAAHKENILFNIDSIDIDYIKKTYRNPDNDQRGLWRTAPLWADSNSNKEKTLKLKDGTFLTKKWFINQETLDRLYADNLVYQAKGSLSKKIFLSEATGQAQMNLLEADRFGTSEEGTKEYKQIMGVANFTNPKSIRLVEHLVSLLHNNPNALILDSFAGSGTTAHAVLNLNKQDGGHRRFILVEMCDYAETITAERVRRVIDGYGEGSKAVEGTGGSFAFYELGDTIYDPQTGLLNDNADTEQIRRYIWYSETNTPYHSPKDCTDDASRVVKDTAAAGDADAPVRGRFGTNRMTMQCCGDDASRVVCTIHPYLLGRKDGTNYYFYYKRGEETVLDRAFLNTFTPADQAEQYIIYADCCRLSRDFMLTHHITFKQIPRDIKKV